MSRLPALVKRAVQLLEEQWASFSELDRLLANDESVSGKIREEWQRIFQLQDFFRREQLPKIVLEASSWEEPRSGAEAVRVLRGAIRFLEEGTASPGSVIDHLVNAFGADRGMMLACSQDSSQARVLGTSRLTDPNLTLEEFRMSRTVFGRILRSGRPVLIEDTTADRSYADQTSILQSRVRSLLAAPIRSRKEVVGILYLDSGRPGHAFSDSDLANLVEVTSLVKLLFFSASGNPVRTAGKGEVFLDDDRAMHGLIGNSAPFREAVGLLKKVAPTPAPVLLTGESGTGKELFARALHALSPRRSGPFVPINCAAIPDSLLESELFGYEKGAFTGADALRIGRVERAARGTLFLDEIGELKLELQAKLLRFLESGEIDRIGGSAPFRVDVRIVVATNQDLAEQVAAGRFRQDLYFRLNVIMIQLPPLRQRKEDLRMLAEHFYQKYAALLDLRSLDVRPEVYEAMASHDYPGNIRELENMVYRSLLLSEDGRVTLGLLPGELKSAAIHDLAKNPFWRLVNRIPVDYADLADRKDQMKQICRNEVAYLERRFAEAVVERAGGNIARAAELAGIDRGQFHRLLKGPG